MKRLTVFVLCSSLVGAVSTNAQSLTGTIAGKVTDEQGGVAARRYGDPARADGAQATVTDEKGEYRFVGLNPGPYEVKAELSGFTPRTERGLDLGIGRTPERAVHVASRRVAETVDVVANASTVDTKTTASDNSLSQDLLSNIPINMGNFNVATQLLDYAPGVNNGSAFGGDSDYGNALLIDGVDTRDPEGGSAWVFYNFNIVEEVQVGGVGAPAEYGGSADRS